MKLVALLLLFSLLISCQAQSTEGVNLSSCTEFATKIEATDHIQLIDVRTPQEYEAGTISNNKAAKAINIDFLADDFDAKMNALDKEKPILIFCAKGGRSAKAARKAKELGFKEIYDLDGGYGAWVQQK